MSSQCSFHRASLRKSRNSEKRSYKDLPVFLHLRVCSAAADMQKSRGFLWASERTLPNDLSMIFQLYAKRRNNSNNKNKI